MHTCKDCARPANVKLTIRDEYERVIDIFVCDEHAKVVQAHNFVVNAQGLNGSMSMKEWMAWRYGQ